jgi:hypothetical protein
MLSAHAERARYEPVYVARLKVIHLPVHGFLPTSVSGPPSPRVRCGGRAAVRAVYH